MPSRLSIFITLPRTIDRSNAKLGEGVNPLFLGLLAVFRVENLSTQCKPPATIVSSGALFVLERILISASAKHLLPCSSGLCVCVRACVRVCVFVCVHVCVSIPSDCVSVFKQETHYVARYE